MLLVNDIPTQKKRLRSQSPGREEELAPTHGRNCERIKIPQDREQIVQTPGWKLEKNALTPRHAEMAPTPGRKRGRSIEIQSPKSVFCGEVRQIASDLVRKTRGNMIHIQQLCEFHNVCIFCQNQSIPTIGSCFNIYDLKECIITDFSPSEESRLTYNSVMDSPDREQWIKAMDKEIAALENKFCCEIAVIPTRQKVNLVRSFFVYKVKRDQNGNIINYQVQSKICHPPDSLHHLN
jgi:hypothetical protein